MIRGLGDRIRKFFSRDKVKTPARSFFKAEPEVSIQMPRGRMYGTAQIHYLGALAKAAAKVYKKYDLERAAWAKRPKVKVGELVRVLPGGRHAVFMSNIGLVRKPYVQA